MKNYIIISVQDCSSFIVSAMELAQPYAEYQKIL